MTSVRLQSVWIYCRGLFIPASTVQRAVLFAAYALCSIEQTLLAECRDGVVTVEGSGCQLRRRFPCRQEPRAHFAEKRIFRGFRQLFSARGYMKPREGEQDAAFAITRRRAAHRGRRELFSFRKTPFLMRRSIWRGTLRRGSYPTGGVLPTVFL